MAEIKAAIDYVSAHPLCTRHDLLTALKETLPELELNTIARQIAFLFQRGHIVEYYNGVLALPEANPKFCKLPEEMKREREAAKAAKPEAAKPAEAPAEQPAPEAEAPAPGAPAEPAAEPEAEVKPETSNEAE